MASSQEKISVYNLADLKNTTDDAIPNYLNSLHFTQSHRLTDVRLALGYSALALAAACFAWDHHLGFAATTHLTACAVALYTVLNGALTAWMLFAERGAVYEGSAPGPGAGGQGERVRIATATPRRNVPVYEMVVEVVGRDGARTTARVSRGFAEWFDGAGRFVAAPFQEVLASAVPVIGRADPKRAVVKVEGEDAAAAYTPEMLDMLARASAAGSAAETATPSGNGGAKRGGRRRKA
ncbi:hypothetical protein BT67DRAFT_463981 [Trichocladium antarcticum]|uniref:Signal peptidase complex subunit 2 n=1 Tax=Trichocladium antarcticum TaxID=1450529 RepID=A0AAN6ZAG6_9PEZI|nr:hypothetical protein BT67DRAFT_463981 [Trichocladium antarcticum]